MNQLTLALPITFHIQQVFLHPDTHTTKSVAKPGDPAPPDKNDNFVCRKQKADDMLTIVSRTGNAGNDRLMSLPVRGDLGETGCNSTTSVLIKADHNRKADSLTRVSKCMTSFPVESKDMTSFPVERRDTASFPEKRKHMTSLPVERKDMTSFPAGITSHPDDMKKTARTVQTGPDGKKEIKLSLDMHEFQPDEIRVRKDRNKLRVHAYHEERDDNRMSCKMFQQNYCLPKNVRVTKMESVVDKDGTLTVKSSLKPKLNVTFAQEEDIGAVIEK